MFKCQVCKTVSKANVGQKTIVLEKRERTYKNVHMNEDDKPVTKYSKGWEIVKEAKVCQACADNHLLATPA